MILLIDNYDGCVYNLYQLAGTCLERMTGEAGSAYKKADSEKITEENITEKEITEKKISEEKIGEPDIRIVRNDKITAEEIRVLAPSHIIISGGAIPPEKAGNDVDIVRKLAGTVPILGICLGFRVICSAFGGKETVLCEPMQGKPSRILLEQGGRTESGIFAGLPEAFMGARYQSTSIAPESITAPLHIIARAEDGDIMGVEAGSGAPLIGLQWHPESFMSEYGMELMSNFLRMERRG